MVKKHKSSINAVYDEEARKEYLLGFHERKQNRRLEGYKKALIKKKQEAMATKFSHRRELKQREKELELESKYPFGNNKIVVSSENITSDFTKNVFGEDNVTVTVQYTDDTKDSEDNESIDKSDEELLNEKDDSNDKEESDDYSEETYPEEEDKKASIFDNLTKEEQDKLNSITLSDKEIAQIKIKINERKKKGKGRKGKGKSKKRKGNRK
ncbi:hypothetical protein WA158_001437 [Blastocystis sp. Blastoise]